MDAKQKTSKKMGKPLKKSPKWVVKKTPPSSQAKKVESREEIKKSLDIRSDATTANLNDSTSMANVSPSINYDVATSIQRLSGVSLSVVCYALQRGWDAYVLPGRPLAAWVYLTEILVAYASGITPKAPLVPQAIKTLGSRLTPKTHYSGTGKVTYRFALPSLDVLSNLSWLEPMGPIVYARNLNLGQIGTSTINGGLTDIVQPPSTTPDTAADSWTTMINFLQQNDDLKGNWQLVPAAIAPGGYDSSAYCQKLDSPGGGYNGTGAWGTQISLETRIYSPVFTGLVAQVNGPNPTRWNKFSRGWSGDALTMGGLVCNVLHPKQLRMQNAPAYKPIDFNELLDVIVRFCVGVVEKAVNDAQNNSNFIESNNNSSVSESITCPLSIQEIALILRATCMNLFKDTQYFVQGIFPRIPSNQNDNEFVPFVCGFGTAARPSVSSMLLPVIFVENLRSLTLRSNMGGKAGAANPQLYIPVLGIYFEDDLAATSSKYVVDYSSATPRQINVFTEPRFVTGKDKKGFETLGAELSVSLIDGKANSSYFCINDPGYLNPRIALWNEWIVNNGNFITDVTSLGTDGGINALASIGVSTHWQEAVLGATEVMETDLRLRKRMRANFGPYNTRQILANTFQNPPIAAAWETLQQVWVTPVIRSLPANIIGDYTQLQRWQNLVNEPHTLTVVESDVPYTLGDRHQKYAEMMVRTRNAPTSMQVRFLQEMAAMGRGGVLSSLVAGFAGMISPEIGNVAKSIASALPF